MQISSGSPRGDHSLSLIRQTYKYLTNADRGGKWKGGRGHAVGQDYVGT